MDMQRSRVTVFAPTGRADLAVPNRVPLALLLPFLFDELKIKGNLSAETWEVAGVDGRAISRDVGLRDADIRDGDLLFVRRAETDDLERYDDVAEIISEEATQANWLPRHTAIAGMAFGVITMLLAVVGVTASLEPTQRVLIGAGAIAALWVAAYVATTCADTRQHALVAVVLAVCWAAVTGNAIAGGGFDGAGVLAAAVAVEAVCVLGCLLLGVRGPLPYAASAFSAFAATGGLVLLATGQRSLAAAIVGAAGIVALVGAPSLALRLSGVSALDNRQDHDGAIPIDQARGSVRRAAQALSGLVTGIAAAMAGAVFVLTRGDDSTAHALAAVVVALTLIRAQTFRDRRQVGALVGCGLCGLIALISVISWTDPLMLSALGIIVAGCFLTNVAVVLQWRAHRLRRLGDIVEMMLMVAVTPVVLAIGGVYGAVLNLWD
ncbi:type VII secretion integral membrane protein EccD [Antricoccus suffuscus]|uniref:Type VII secretion integral membrane protein EccD n=1 Tax=Antricoccus suffuscus TaxID=1629062 RepID=A0A2T1A3D8_9ACTN|nr:type VII secretion integral membrane protein EccD [Antricoccus suffuscus]PRZ43054.1 type VII secretion integral membrane protein EccD [Antricoccus suffuscus]